MIEKLKYNFEFLTDLDDDEKIVALSNQKDRGLVIHMLMELPDGRLESGLY